MYLSVSEALRKYDVGRNKIYRDMEEGTLSYEIGPDGKKRKINVAELDRCYEKRNKGRADEPMQGSGEGGHNNSEKQPEKFPDFLLFREIIEERIDGLKDQIRSQEEEIERWQEAHKDAQTAVTRITALLEDKREEGGLSPADKKIEKLTSLVEDQLEDRKRQDEKIKALEEKISTVGEKGQRLLQALKEEKKRRLEAENRVKEEQSKGFWKRLVG